MALIGKIREQSTLLMIVIGVGMILFIVPYDSIMKMFSGGQTSDSIGMFNGEPMYSKEWNYEYQVNDLKRQYFNAQREISDADARNGIFNQMIQDTLINTELRLVGVRTTLDELDALQTGEGGVEISSYIKQLPHFKDANGIFNRDSLDKKLSFFMNQEGGNWDIIEKELSRSNRVAKYVSMISKGIIVTDYEAKRDYTENNEKANVKYVYKKFSEVPDSAIVVTDADYQAFYDEHKDEKRYEMQETRGFDFVAIDIKASEDDKKDHEQKIGLIKDAFKSAINDSLFVINNSDNPVYNEEFVAANQFPLEMDTMVQKAQVGDIVDPYLGAGGTFWQIAKVVQSDSAYEAKVRHILIGVNQQNPADGVLKKVKADSIKDVWSKKGNFSELLKFSTDVDKDGKANNDGVYDWFTYGAMVPEFEEYSMTGKIGVVEVVQTQFGYHVMEVLDRRTNGKVRVKAPVIVRNIVPGEAQIGAYKDSAYRFIQAAKEAGDFKEYCKSKGFFAVETEQNIMVTRPFMNSPVLQNSNSILRWAFNAEMNEISDYFEMNGSYKLVVAQLNQNIPEGLPSFETAKQVMKLEVTNIKKGEYLAAQASGVNDLVSLSAKWGALDGQQTATGVSFKDKNLDPLPNPQQQQQQQTPDEAEVMGTIFTLEPGKLSKPIKGTQGMYVVMVDAFVPITKQKEDFITEKITLESELRARADSGVMRALIDKADVKDYRKKNELIDSE